MTSIHISVKTIAASTAGTASDLPGLQKKMAALMKDLQDASQDISPGAKERMKLLQVQVQACAMQIQQLESAAAQKALLKKAAEPAHAQPIAAGKAAPDVTSTLGSQIDTKA